MILTRGSGNISRCSDSVSQLGQGGRDTAPIPLASLGVCWFGRLAVRQHAGCKPEPGAPAVPRRLMACAQLCGERCFCAVCLTSGARAAGSRPSPGVPQSLQTLHRERHTCTGFWHTEDKDVMTSASLGLVSDRLVLYLILGW